MEINDYPLPSSFAPNSPDSHLNQVYRKGDARHLMWLQLFFIYTRKVILELNIDP